MGNFSKSSLPPASKKQESGLAKGSNPTVQLKDNRAEHAAQLKFAQLANSQRADETVQRKELEEEEVQLAGIEEKEIQMKSVDEEEELQMKSVESPTDLSAIPVQRAENNTGLPDQLKSGVESLSGFSLDDVKVHYNSDKPSQLQAHAYAQGTDIHVAPGQEKHLPHEAWHVVQQKQGRVKATRQMKGKVNINDDAGLENEADVMGAKAVQGVFGDEGRVDHEQNRSRLVGPNTRQFPVQRNEESTQVLGNLAEPKVGQQDIELASAIQDEIEKIYTDTIEKDGGLGDWDLMKYNSAVCLGGIVLPSLRQYNDLGTLLKDCDFVNLGKGAVSLGIYELLPADLKKSIVRNTLMTMYDAGQLDYLWYSKFGGRKKSAWKVVVEVHYYRERPTTSNVFHKDTLGKTLFVNLNYLNKKKIVGPEYVVNPQDSPEHLKKIAKTLPKEFLKDRKSVMGELDQPEVIDVVEVPKYGYVAFVDEIIHHSSPTTEHRQVKGLQIRTHLQQANQELFKTYSKAYQKWSERSSKKQNKTYGDYLKKKYRTDASDWQIFFDNNDPKKKYDRNGIRTMDPSKKFISDLEVGRILHEANYGGFGEASIPNPGDKSIKSPITKENRPLKRTMSMKLDSEEKEPMDKEDGGRRSFFRTWVRAEKKDEVVTNEDWKWNQMK